MSLLPYVYSSTGSYNEILRTNKVGTFSLDITLLNPTLLDWGDGSAAQTIPAGQNVTTHSYTQAGEKQIKLRDGYAQVSRMLVPNQGITAARLSKFRLFANALYLDNNLDLKVIELPETSSAFALRVNLTTFAGVLDISVCPGVTQVLAADSSFTGLKGKAGMSALQTLQLMRSNITGVLDLSYYTGLRSTLDLRNNPNMTGVLFPVNTVAVVSMYLISCNLTGTLDTTPLTMNGSLYVPSNPLLTNVLVKQGTSLANLIANNCALNTVFPFGSGFTVTTLINLASNNMSAANVNANVDNIYQNKGAFVTTAKTLNLTGNAAPTGTALTQIADLRANYNWTITHS